MRRKILIISLLLSAITLAVYWQVVNHDLIQFDDHTYVTDNVNIQTGLTEESVIWAFTSTRGALWIPLTWISYMLDFELFGMNPGGYHFTNLLLHLANTLLLFFVLKRMTGAVWKSGFVAAMFALHPLRVESVAWVTERKDVLSTLFFILTLWAYAHYSKWGGLTRYLLILLTFVLGLMAKPMLVTLPFVLLLLDFWPLNRFGLKQAQKSIGSHPSLPPTQRPKESTAARLLWEKTPLFVISAVFCVVTYVAQQSLGGIMSLGKFHLSVRLANALVSYVRYIGKMIWPWNLAIYYPHPGASLPWWKAFAAALLLICITFAAVRFARRYPFLTVGWLWYLGTLAPVIGLVQSGTQAMADRFTYIPLTGLFVMIAWGIPELTAKWRHRKVALATAAGSLLLLWITLTSLQLAHWRDNRSLFDHALAVTKNNYFAHKMVGDSYYQQGKSENALLHYSEAIRINPDYFVAHYKIAQVLANKKQFKEAIAYNLEALRIEPDFFPSHNALGIIFSKEGKFDEAVVHFYKALEFEPNLQETHNNLAIIRERQGRIEEAIYHYSTALQLKPESAVAYFNLGNALARFGKNKEAISSFSMALKLKPDFAEALNSCGVLLALDGRLDEAIVHFSEALQLNPDFELARANLERALQNAGRTYEMPASGPQPETKE